jgi:hypothetical protein
MRIDVNKWQFYNNPTKAPLSGEEIRYWKMIAEKTLKVGIEFEFNLPDQKGTCHGDNVHCPCVHMSGDCWKGCINTKTCASLPVSEMSFYTCASKTDPCKKEKCVECKNYKFKCLGITCVDFVSHCFVCDKYAKSCEKCDKKYIPEKDPKMIRDKLQTDFAPSRRYGKVSPSGVVDIKTDGSLLGDKGAEIITIGRRVDYWEFMRMTEAILRKMEASGAFINERTGSHMHVLTSYIDREVNELERPIPQIIAANFHQLVRRYQNALTWLTIALDTPKHMTRWEKFRVSVLHISPVTRDMCRVKEDVHQGSGGNKYGFINYDNMVFNNDNDITCFHVEFREADSTMCPSYYAALACLHYAFVVKAIEISRYGLLKVGDEAWMKKAAAMKNVILNGTGNWESNRLGDTSKLLDNKDYFIEESMDLVRQMKSILIKIGPAYDVLKRLAKKPVALRRIEGDSWKQIESSLAVQMSETDVIHNKINELIDLQLIIDCRDMDEWIKEVKNTFAEERLDFPEDHIRNHMETRLREGQVIWSTSLGCPIII